MRCGSVDRVGAGSHLVAVEAFFLEIPDPKPGLVDADQLPVQVFPDEPAVAEAFQNSAAARTADAVVIADLFAVVAIHR